MCIFNQKILKKSFKNYLNFEKDFYPKLLREFKTDIYTLKGFWCAVDNVKHLAILNKKKLNKKNYYNIYKLKKTLNDK
jgi:NDP-sugar pyrophosphorylase family protein